mmetsp:Transcript_8041/g.10220  ORF Transcript_8041/g.10220 Transcript_8041/m.10220 type:complete len:514 (-) Transcript_8041:105-1646(-)
MLYCDTCSSYTALIHPADVVYPPDWDSLLSSFDPREPLRVCRGCAEQLAPMQDELGRTTSNAAQETTVDRNAYERYMNVPIQFDMRSEIQKATHTLLNFCDDNAIEGSDSVPKELIAGAWGLAFVTTMQAGFFFSGRVGSGLVIARTPDGNWSAPSAVCTAGAGWGLQIGGEITDMLIVLNSQDAVDAFASTAQLTLGTELSLALGPMGRSAETNMTAGDGGVSAVFSYAHSKGFFVGIALQACVILARPDCNEKFYGKRHDTAYILSGKVEQPLAAKPLYDALKEVMEPDANEKNPEFGFTSNEKIIKEQPPQKVAVKITQADPSRFVDDIRQQEPVRATPVRATPLSRSEQEQIDADLALALALNEEEQAQAVAAVVNRRGPPSGPVGDPREFAVTEPVRNGNSSSSWFGFMSSSEPQPPPNSLALHDAWASERNQRLNSSTDHDIGLSGTAEELKPIRNAGNGDHHLRAAAPKPPYYNYKNDDDDNTTVAGSKPAAPVPPTFRTDEEVTL